jgi:hypothetical protein
MKSVRVHEIEGDMMAAISRPTLDKPWALLDVARSFKIGADRCATMVQTGENTFEAPISPAIVCSAFACEVYLKSLASLPGEPIVGGHDLKYLFEALPSEIKIEISDKFESDFGSEIGPHLSDLAKSFVEWRYIYENNGPKSLNFKALTCILNALRLVAEKRLGDTRPK